ncbi:MAG: hypothetical protein CM15mP49_07540 [Actinomycetota bacterium]|nr:MAG: hypothetical protein CM15mP49_07540 [Actinomycetota bacterium]
MKKDPSTKLSRPFSILRCFPTGENLFWGFKLRESDVDSRSPKCQELALHPLINSLCETYLTPYSNELPKLHFTPSYASDCEDPQILHRDRGVWGSYVNRSIETQFSTIWAISQFHNNQQTTQNGSGSHKWDKDRQPNENEMVSCHNASRIQ